MKKFVLILSLFAFATSMSALADRNDRREHREAKHALTSDDSCHRACHRRREACLSDVDSHYPRNESYLLNERNIAISGCNSADDQCRSDCDDNAEDNLPPVHSRCTSAQVRCDY